MILSLSYYKVQTKKINSHNVMSFFSPSLNTLQFETQWVQGRALWTPIYWADIEPEKLPGSENLVTINTFWRMPKSPGCADMLSCGSRYIPDLSSCCYRVHQPTTWKDPIDCSSLRLPLIPLWDFQQEITGVVAIFPLLHMKENEKYEVA